MSKTLVIGCDFDDTMTNLLYTWVTWLNRRYNLNVTVEDIKSWKMDTVFPTLTQEQICEPLRTPRFWDLVCPRDHAVDTITKIINDGHQFYVVTSTDYRVMPEKAKRCLFKHFPFLDKSQLIITYNKQLLNLDVLIDDALHNMVGGKYVKILIDMPHNRQSNNIEDFRVYGWDEIYPIIQNLSNVVD